MTPRSRLSRIPSGECRPYINTTNHRLRKMQRSIFSAVAIGAWCCHAHWLAASSASADQKDAKKLQLVRRKSFALDTKVLALALSPDGKTIAAGGGGGDGLISTEAAHIKLLDVSTGKVSATLKGHQRRIRALVFSPDGKSLLSGSSGAFAATQGIVWNVTSRKPKSTRNSNVGPIYEAAYSSSGRMIALAGGGSEVFVELWGAKRGKLLGVLKKPMGRVLGIAFSPDEKLLACGCLDGRTYLWQTKSRKLIKTLTKSEESKGGIHAVAFSPDGKTLVAGDSFNGLFFFDVAKLEQTGSFRAGGKCVAFSPDGRLLATGGLSGQVVVLGAGERTWQRLAGGSHKKQVHGIAFSPDGETLVSGSSDGTVCVWELSADLRQR